MLSTIWRRRRGIKSRHRRGRSESAAPPPTASRSKPVATRIEAAAGAKRSTSPRSSTQILRRPPPTGSRGGAAVTNWAHRKPRASARRVSSRRRRFSFSRVSLWARDRMMSKMTPSPKHFMLATHTHTHIQGHIVMMSKKDKTTRPHHGSNTHAHSAIVACRQAPVSPPPASKAGLHPAGVRCT